MVIQKDVIEHHMLKLLGTIEDFKQTSKNIKKIIIKKFIDDLKESIIDAKYSIRFKHTQEDDIKDAIILQIDILYNYLGVMYRCFDDNLLDDEFMSNEEEVKWMGNSIAFDFEAILSRLKEEDFDKMIIDLNELQRIIASSQLDNYVYVKEK